MADLIFSILAVLSLVLTIWRWLVSERFPLHRRAPVPAALPGLTVLKPLKGSNGESSRCLRSWFLQKYPGPVQILFGVPCADDPVCLLVRELLAEFPQADAQLIICAEDLGANGKVSTLRQLEPHIRHPILMISDADVEVRPDFASAVAPLLATPGAGLVNCFYRLANPATTAMHLEAIAINADFWSLVLQARSLGPIKFALGAVMTLPVTMLRQIGGFAALAHYLADDYELGQLIWEAGGRIEFSGEVVDCREPALDWKEVWKHQLRWARTIRVCQPLPYFMSVLGNATLWPLLWLLMEKDPIATPFFVVAILFRTISAALQQKRLTQSHEHSAYWWMTPIRDILDVLIWAAAFWGNHVEWRGERYHVSHGGHLEKVKQTAS